MTHSSEREKAATQGHVGGRGLGVGGWGALSKGNGKPEEAG